MKLTEGGRNQVFVDGIYKPSEIRVMKSEIEDAEEELPVGTILHVVDAMMNHSWRLYLGDNSFLAIDKPSFVK